MSKTTTLSVTATAAVGKSSTGGGGGRNAATAGEFDVPAFEQKLKELKDTQDSIQQLSAWCLQRRTHHKKIVSSWLNVLKQVKVENRLTLFYLANDVIQYSKRKNYEYVDSWGTYLQKATTLVRDEKVKHKILRIFKIWEQREIYNDEFLADLNGLLSATSAKKSDSSTSVTSTTAPATTGSQTVTLASGPSRLTEQTKSVVITLDVDDFQSASLVSTIKDCVKNETDTDTTFKSLNKTPLVDVEMVRNSIKGKERKRVEDIEHEIEENLVHYQSYVHSLKTEIKSRKLLLSLLEQADTFYHNQRGEVKVVVNAYRNFGNRLKSMKKKLDELTTTLPSPMPSPDINAPSPEPDMDLQLPDDQSFFNVNGMMNSYMDGNLPFDINDFRRDSPTTSADTPSSQHYGGAGRGVGPPVGGPPPPPTRNSAGSGPYVPSHSSSSSLEEYGNGAGGPDYTSGLNSYGVSSNVVVGGGGADYGLGPRPNNHHNMGMARSYGAGPQYNQPMLSDYPAGRSQPGGPRGPHLPPPAPVNLDRSDEYNSTWDMSMTWDGPHDSSFQSLDTPVSPPHYERKGVNSNVIEYIDGVNEDGPLQDVDHRQLPNMPIPAFMKDKGRLMDVDHRNLISLTGSPGPLLSKSGLDDLEDIDDDDDDDVLLLEENDKTDSKSKEQPVPAPVSPPARTKLAEPSLGAFPWGTGTGDVDLRQTNLNLLGHASIAIAPTTSSSSTSIATSSTSEPKDLDMRIQSMQQTLDSRFGGGESQDESKGADDALQLLQTPTSLLEIDDFLQNFERENFDLSKPPTVLMSNQTESSPSPPPSLMDVTASTPKNAAQISNDADEHSGPPTDNNESVDMDLSDEEYVPEHPTEASTALHDEPIEDSTEPYEPFEGEDIDDAFMPLMNPTLSSQDESVASIPTPPVIPQNQPEQQQQPQQIPLPPQQHRPPLLPDPEYPPPFAFQAQQQQPQRKQWDMPPPQFNNFGSGLPNLADLANFGEFPNLAAGLNNLNPPQPAGLPPHMWNNQQQPPPMGPMGGGGGPMGGNQFNSPNRPPFGGSPFNNNNNKMNNFRNHNNNSWGGGGRGGGGGGGPRHGSPYFRGGGGGGRGNFRGGNNKFRGGHHNNNRGGNWLDSFLRNGGDILELIDRFAPR
ncbi:uncharacterized protein LOC5571655 isoform X4 [Aedes aegypti]|uniref:Regulation of nuclear pre-mRNA domain-containing protein 2 n=1 Tax=Aedes aegypti TaxID=7159 RepID=A0A6I8T5C4_AEDAE|nr:uncharacterized protein LOC5571655 isoform X4 [Aedes aegypti]